MIGRLAAAGYVVALDEFQYIHRKQLSDFCSLLQAEVDRLAARAADIPCEGYALEDLAGQLYEERSRLGLGGFPLSERIRGYWDRADVEIDLVAVNEDERRIRFGTCKRNPERLPDSVDGLQRSAARFLNAHSRFNDWQTEYVAIAPIVDAQLRGALATRGVLAESLDDLMVGL